MRFNLWTEPWLSVFDPAGRRSRVSLRDALGRAADWVAVEDPSPIFEAGLLRLLAAIAQAAVGPGDLTDRQVIWGGGRFDSGALDRFGARYADRFDLFHEVQPFGQSGDMDVSPPADRSKIKPVAYLAPDLPTGINSTWFRHADQWSHAFCPACCAAGLAALPAFATSGGASFTKSINGIPPIYAFPVGANLFETIAAMLLAPDYWPTSAHPDDQAWWDRTTPTVVARGRVLGPIGYLAALTFAPRRVRLYPDEPGACTRCGQQGLLVRGMAWQGGERYSPDAPAWRDPFVAYRHVEKRNAAFSVKPVAGMASWQACVPVLLGTTTIRRPALLDQAEACGQPMRFRCISLATDKAKYLEWQVAGEWLPSHVLWGAARATVQAAYLFTEEVCDGVGRVFGGAAKVLGVNLKETVTGQIWQALEWPFREWVDRVSTAVDDETVLPAWREITTQTALQIALAQMRAIRSPEIERLDYSIRGRLNQINQRAVSPRS